MKKISTLAMAGLFGLVCATAAFAQTPTGTAVTSPSKAVPPVAAPAKPTVTPATTTASDKAAMSKKCSADADAKGLHGKARKEFRNKCKEGK